MYFATLGESLKRIIETPIGTRVMNPEFGSRLYELIDKRMDSRWKLDFIRFTYEAITKWEPRVKIEQVIIDAVEDSKVYYTLKFSDNEDINGQFNTTSNS